MLEELRVLNGELSPKYDKNNNKYTVKISNNDNKVDFIFKEDEYLNIAVYGNDNLKVGENKIVIAVSKDDNINYIFITAIKEEEQEVMSFSNYNKSLEVSNSVPLYAGFLIGTSCFLIILLLFVLMFVRKKKKR